MRVLLIGSANPWRMEASVQSALRRAGHETLLLDDRRLKRRIGRRLTQDWVLRRAARFGADFVFLSKCTALDLDTVATLVAGRPNAMWYHDPQWHRDLDRLDIAHIAAVGRLARTFFVTGFVEEWRAHGLNAAFLPAAGDAAIRPVPPEPRFRADVTFIGTAYDEERTRLLLEVARHHHVKVWGLGWERWRRELDWDGRAVEHREFAAVCASSKAVLGIAPTRAAGGFNYTSDRTWMVLLAGGFLLAQAVPGLTTMLREGEHCAWYDDVDGCLAQLARYLPDDTARARIQERGERHARDHHTYDQRIRNLLSGEPYVIGSHDLPVLSRPVIRA